MRLEMPQTKNKSDDEPRELNFAFSCFVKTPNRYGTAYVGISEKAVT